MKKDIVVLSAFYMNHVSGNNRTSFIPRFLAEHGHQVELVCPNFDHHTKQYIPNLSALSEGVPYKITFLRTTPYRANVAPARVVSQIIFGHHLKRYLNSRVPPDVVYAFIPSLEVGMVARQYAAAHNIKFVIDVRDLWPEVFNILLPSPRITEVLFYSQKISADAIYMAADEVIAVSDTYRARVMQVNSKASKGHTIYLGTELAKFDAAASIAREKGKPREGIAVVYAGTLGNSYDLETLFSALHILRHRGHQSLKCLIMGDGPLEGAFRAKARTLGVEAEFTGRLPYQQMVSRLVTCDIAVNTLRKGAAQSIINKHADYAAAGLPVVSNQENEEYRQLVEGWEIGFNCRIADAMDMAAKLEMLIVDPALRERMGKNHRRLAEEKFDRNKTYGQILSLL